MTSLAHQLKRLALPQSDPSLLARKEVASLLFDPQDAATMDRSTFYALGCTGLEELLGIEPAFLEFQETLFSSASLTMERSVQSREVNQKLDGNISLFLARLSPYFLLKPAHKCMEWLVHRFHIHRYNVDSLLACALPYHNTNVFVRVLQLLDISDATNRWNWLHCLQKPGVPLSKGTLITHCYSDLSFLDFICTMVTRSIEAYSGPKESYSQLRVIFSFYASTIIPAVEAMDKVSDSFISKLLPYIQKGLKSMLMDYKAASYMIVGQLAVKVVMEASLVDTLAVHISKSLLKEPVLAKEGVGCLIVLLQNQKDGAVGPRASTHLRVMPTLVSTLEVMALTHDVGPLLHYLLPHLIRAVFTCSSAEARELAVLTSILQSLPLTSGLDQTVARLLLDEYVRLTELSDENMTTLNQRLQPLIRLLESRYCVALDTVLGGHVTVGGTKQKRLFHEFLSLTMSSGKYQFLGDSDTSLLLSLKHPQPSIRVSAVEHLMSIVTDRQHCSLTDTFLNDAITDRLKDDVPEVVAATLKVVELLYDILEPEHIMSCLLSVLHRAEPSDKQWLPVLIEVVRLLSDPRLGNGDAELVQSACWRLLPFLVITSPTQSSLAACVARSPVITQHPLTLNWAEELDETMKQSSEANFVGLANQRLVSTLVKNLANMEHFTRHDALEKLALAVEEQRSGDTRARVSFLVLTQTLLLSLGELKETQHLLTAQRVYLLLEPPLLELIKNSSSQEAEPNLSCPQSFSAALTAYLSRCDGQDRYFGFTLLSLLRDFIAALRCHDMSFKDEVWWNPEKLDSHTCCYLSLTCRLFSITINGGMEGPAASTFRALMKLLIKVHLPKPLMLFRFLCVLWGHSSNDNQLDAHIDVILQTQALHMGGALLAKQPVAILEELAAANSPVVPSLLCCLSSPVQEVRRSSFGALQSLSRATASPFQPIMNKLQKTADELIADPSYLSQALGNFHENIVTSKTKQHPALQQLLQSIQVLCCPSYSAVALLRVMSQVNGQWILSALLPLLERLLEQSSPDTPNLLRAEAQLMLLILSKYNEASAPLLAQDQNCLDLFIRALRSSTQQHPDIPSCQIYALEQITKPFFSAVEDESVQQRLLSVMFDLLADNPSPLVAITINSVFKRISVDGQLVANELAPTAPSSVSMTVQQSRRSRLTLRNPQKNVEVSPEGGAVPWQRVSLILELLQHKKKLRRAQMLVPALFSLLSRSLEPHSADHTNMEYTKQLLLSCLQNICTKLAPDGGPVAADVLDEDKFMVELVVQCIRASDVPQTHHHALLLLGTAATIFPEKVLLNIMPIFTFMGSNIMRLDDAYSFRVINKTVEMVIPALIQARRLSDDSSSHVDAVVTRIIHVFADALPHVPEHRRLPVLVQLVMTLGPARFLWVLMLLLFKLHATHTASATSEKDAALEKDVDFWISLCSQFEVGEQLASLNHILGFLLQLPEDKDEGASKHGTGRRGAQKKKEEKMEELIFSVEAHSSKELRHFKFISVSFMAQLLGSASFIGKVAGGDDVIDESLQQLQQKLLEDLLRYIHSVARSVEENADKPTAKFWRVLLNKAYDVLDKVNSLLPTDTFIVVMRGLMGNELPSVRRKAMELLNNKLLHRTQWDQDQVAALMQLTSDLLGVVGKCPGKVSEAEEAEQAINRQTALYSLKLLCRSFGSAHQEALLPVLAQSVDIISSPEEEKNVAGSALLCIAEVVSTLKALAIPQLPRLMPAVLAILKDRKDLLTNEIFLLSAVTALQHVIETLLHFISPYLRDATSQVCRLTHLAETSSSSTATRLSTRLSSIRTTLATKLPPRVLLPTVAKCYDDMVIDRKGQLGALMSILKEHICQMEKDQLNSHQSELTSFFLIALDFRAEHSEDDLETTATTEGYVIDCLVAMVMKLSEVTFRTLFFKLCDWRKSDTNERLLTFCRLTDHIAGRLKGLFVLFAGNLVKPFADLLRQSNSSSAADALFESGQGEQKVALLLQYVLDCLHKIFLYDTQRFLSRERADALMGPLLDQLENTAGAPETYRQRVTGHLIPCVGQFAVALADDTQWKTLNYQILLKSRHADAKVRFSSLLMLMELTSKLKENYMVLLPETIPFLAELMEDECEEVEQQVQKVVQEMENILGEPLQSYF
ncbi:HEAT repeat-containing protein 1 [Takifugu rubripes]|uniref:HEAT repeat-containing protein 1 n=1 Tax=Takifugu rubripes TaxID=31033 RepID=A0A674PRM0_TAKRU|nr:HEAT repeat-containing protein 1 [Takifugu rubripes]XP_029695503.1 HEAT repeat-containing protein 1 [Takifugu rubripes]